MGNSSSRVDIERLNEITTEACDLFLDRFPIYFEDELFQNFDEIYREKRKGLLLKSHPKLEFPLKQGILFKRGAQVKNWKRRKFVALNEANNFDIAYYKLYKGKTLKRGVISCCGYRVEMFEEGEEDEFGKYGFKLVPNDDSRRCWWFRAEDDEEKKEWEDIFSNACRRAKPERYNIAIIRNSFDRAFQSLRFSYGYFGPLEVTGSEEEMLYDFIGSQILHRELLQDVFNSIPPGPEKQNQIAEIKLLVNRTVSTAVDTTWKKTLSIALPLLSSYFFLPPSNPQSVHRLMQLALEERSSENRVSALHTIFGETYFLKFYNTIQVEQEIQNKVCSSLASIVDPVILDVASTTCAPLLQAIIDSVVRAFSETVDGYRSAMESIVVSLISETEIIQKKYSQDTNIQSSIDDTSSPPGTPLTNSPLSNMIDDIPNTSTINESNDLLTNLLDNEHLSVSGGFHSGPLQAARSTLWTMYTVNLNQPEVLDCFSRGGLTAYEVYTRVSDSIVSLSHNGIYTFGLLLKQAVEMNGNGTNYALYAEKIYIQCVNMMAADSMLTARKVLIDILNSVIDPVVQEMIILPAADVIQQLQILVPINLRKGFNMESCGERLIHQMVDNVLRTLVEQLLSRSYEIDGLASHSPSELTIL